MFEQKGGCCLNKGGCSKPPSPSFPLLLVVVVVVVVVAAEEASLKKNKAGRGVGVRGVTIRMILNHVSVTSLEPILQVFPTFPQGSKAFREREREREVSIWKHAVTCRFKHSSLKNLVWVERIVGC